MMISPGLKVRYLLLAEGVYTAVFGRYFPGKIFVSVRCVSMLTFHCSIRVSVLVYAGVGSGYSVWMLFRCMVSNVLVFASVIVALNSAVLPVAWQGCCVCPVLQRVSVTDSTTLCYIIVDLKMTRLSGSKHVVILEQQ